MSFSPDGRFLAFEAGGSVGVMDPASASLSQVALNGTMAGIAFPAGGRLAAVVALSAGRADLAVFAPFVGPVFRGAFSARETFLGTVGGQLLLGVDGRLLRVDLVAM